MLRPTPTYPPRGRRGNILIVTLLLLALFAIVGLTVVYYTKGQAQRAIAAGDAQKNADGFPDDGMSAFNAYLGGLLYDAQDSGQGLLNAIRGHSLAATMYGRNTYTPPNPANPAQPSWTQGGTTTAWNGVGTFHEQVAVGAGFDRAFLVNHQAFTGIPALYDPGFAGSRAPNAQIGTGQTYIPKNAPYTYPDLKDFYLARVLPTGEVVVPSYYRRAAFVHPSQPAGSTGLEPLTLPNGTPNPNGNPNWTTPDGRYRSPRPRPADHAGFPPVPPNPDGTYTGDVQNLPGGIGLQKNDSVWVDLGLPVITLPGGKKVKPLVAALVVDLDGKLQLSVHGNILGPNGTHSSGGGIGAWEVNLERAFPTISSGQTLPDGRLMVQARGPSQTRAGVLARTYASRSPAGNQLPYPSFVPWVTGTQLGGSALASLIMPGNGGNPVCATDPACGTGHAATNVPITNHPALYNPAEWPMLPGQANRAYPLSDAKILNFRVAATPSFYKSMDLGNTSPTTPSSLKGMYSLPTPFPPAYNTASNYRLDPMHLNRQIVTTYGFGLDRPGVMPNFANLISGGALSLNAGPDMIGGVFAPPPVGPYPSPATPLTPGAVTDFTAQNQWSGLRAALGPLDLNRPLADYRDPTTGITQRLSFGNCTNYAAAEMDRQRLATAIYGRLVVATGALAAVSVNTNGDLVVAPLPTAQPPELNALRSLAQLAVNIVDYIDNDDISTPLAWNPTGAAPTGGPTDIVYGVEKPRLVLHEAYCEVVNDPTDPTFGGGKPPPAAKPALIRFWLELQNPSMTLGTAVPTASGPLADGSVDLLTNNAYRVEIVRSSPQGSGANVSDVLRNPANPYNPGNTTGAILDGSGNPLPADLILDFNQLTGAPPSIPPANGNPTGGLLVVGADTPKQPMTKTTQPEFDSTSIPSVVKAAAAPATAGVPGGSLTYTMPLATAFAQRATSPSRDLRHHVILLRRLANPYQKLNDPKGPGYNAALPPNPYITIDYLDHVPAADRVVRADRSGNNRTARSSTRPGYDPDKPPAPMSKDPHMPQSLGKVQPYASWTDPALMTPPPVGSPPTFPFPQSLVLRQTPTTPPAGTVMHSFGQHNGMNAAAPAGTTYTPGNPAGTPPAQGVLADTIMTPYDWLVHLDRPLLNQLELLHVTGGKPHELTLRFIVPNAPANATDVVRHAHTAHWGLPGIQLGQFQTPPPQNTGLLRALDALRIQPYGHMTGLGGRLAGRINLNTITDKRVWDALFDAQGGNLFTQAQVDAMWANLMASRSPNGGAGLVTRNDAAGNQLKTPAGTQYQVPVAGKSVYDSPTPDPALATPGAANTLDRPFLPFGVAQVAALPPGPPPAWSAMTSGVSEATDGLLRLNTTVSPTVPPTPWLTAGMPPTAHPYQQVEAARKILNNTTTVSHGFAVWATVGYFDVETETTSGIPGVPNFVQLGKEYYKEVPGDLRRKFFAIVDRSMMGMDPQANVHYPASTSQSSPFFTTLEGVTSTTRILVATSGNSFLYAGRSDDAAIGINVGDRLVIGTGSDQEVVTVAGVNNYGGGITTFDLATPLTKNHAAGETVSNFRPGNPGPQSGFNVNSPLYKAVVPYWSRLP